MAANIGLPIKDCPIKHRFPGGATDILTSWQPGCLTSEHDYIMILFAFIIQNTKSMMLACHCVLKISKSEKEKELRVNSLLISQP